MSGSELVHYVSCRPPVLYLRSRCHLPAQAGLRSSQFMVCHDRFSPLFTPDQVQVPAPFRNRKNAHHLTETSGRLSHAYKLTNRERRLHHAPQSELELPAQVRQKRARIFARPSMG
jgi:hypothetical protein